MHAIENAKVAAPASPPAVALQTQLQLQLPGPGPGPRPGPRPRPRDINKTRQLRIAAILVSMSSVEGVCPIWGLNNARGGRDSCAFDCLIKAVWSGLVCPGYAGLDALLCIGRRMRLAALELCPCCLSSLRGQRTIRIKPSSVLNAVAITRGRERERERDKAIEREREGEKQLYPACTHALMNLHGIYRCVLAVIVTNLGGSGRAQGGQRSSSSLNIRALGGNGSASTLPPTLLPGCMRVCSMSVCLSI